MLALASHIASISVTLARLTAAISSCVALASVHTSPGMKATGAARLAAATAATIRGAFVASTRHLDNQF